MLEIITGSITNGEPALGTLLLCTICSIALGFAVSGAYMYKNKYSRTMAISLVLVPATVQIIIMLVGSNIGAGIALVGAFSLVRFRSIPGNARDITCLFIAMALGFVTGMGFLFYAVVFLLLIGCVSLLMTHFRFGQGETDTRSLKITIPENLDYDSLFDDVFVKYTKETKLEKVKTTNMGSLYELTYTVRLKSESEVKAFIDEIRCRNGNLNILLSRETGEREEL